MSETFKPGRAKQGLPYRKDGGGDPLAYLMLRPHPKGNRATAAEPRRSHKHKRKAKS